MEELKKTKAKISMYDILHSFPSQMDALLRTLDHTKQAPTTFAQKGIVAKINAAEAMPTMFKDILEV